MRSLLAAAGLAFLLAVLGATGGVAQPSPVTVSGTVVDSTGAPLPGANAILLRPEDALMVGFSATDREGSFRIERVDPGAYRLRVTFVGFAPHEAVVEVEEADLDVGRVVLREATDDLGEIVVTERRTVAVRRDTVEYDATAIALRQGATVEDLLRRLPGVEVEQDGQIRAQGQAVRRVLVDGEEFFPDAPTATTRHLPADAVDRVQVYDDQPPGGGRGERTINLALKPDRRTGTFGLTSLGAGPTLPAERAPRFTGSLGLNRFTPRLRMALIAGANNVNEAILSVQDYIGLSGALDASPSPVGGTTTRRIDLTDAPVGPATEGFMTTWLGGANVLRNLGERTTLQASYLGFRTDAERDRRTLRRQALGAEMSFRETDDVEQERTRTAHRVNALARATYAPDHELRLRATLTASGSALDRELTRERFSEDGTPLGTSFVAETGASDAAGAALVATYQRPLGAGLTLFAEAGAQGEARRESAALDADGSLATGTPEEIAQERTTGEAEGWATATGVLSIGGGHRLIALAEARLPYHTLAQEGTADATPGTFRRWMPTVRSGLAHRWARGSIETTARLHVQALRLEAGFLDAVPLQQRSALYLQPGAHIEWFGPRNQRLGLEVVAGVRQPTAAQLAPVTDVSSPFQRFTGNPSLEPERLVRAAARYIYFDGFTNTTINAFLTADYVSNAISAARITTDVLVPEVTPVNLGVQTTVSLITRASTPLGQFHRIGHVAPRLTWRGGRELVNGQENAFDLLSLSVDLGFSTRPERGPEVQLGTRIETFSTRFSLSPALSRTFTLFTPYAEATWEPTEAWELNARAEQELYAGTVDQRHAARPLLTLGASRSIGPDGLRLGVTLADLFDRTRRVNYLTTPFSTEETTARTLGRHLYVTLSRNL